MASFQIFQDQENIIRGEHRHKQNANQKRTVLGVIDTNLKNEAAPLRGKGMGVPKDVKAIASKEPLKSLVNPVVPVAQFEAFKVYEDSKSVEIRREVHQKTEELECSIKEEIVEKENVQIVTKEKVENLEYVIDSSQEIKCSPMNLLNSSSESIIVDDSISKNKCRSESFFEVEEYRADIYAYLREHELRHRPKPLYMRKQPNINHNMRTILVDWLVEVGLEYKLRNETLYLAVNFIDRFLSYMSVVTGKLQLVGTSAMFVASKYEEIFPPRVGEFAYITDNTYTQSQVIRMEHLILKVLGFDLSIPTPLTFINSITTACPMSKKIINLAKYMCELSLLEAEPFLEFLPSVLACSAIAIARHILQETVWPSELLNFTKYRLTDLETCIQCLSDLFKKAPDLQQHAIQDKYKTSAYLQVALISPPDSNIRFD